MLIEETFSVAAPRERVWALIRDPNLMVACVPGCESIEEIDPTHYRTAVKVTVGPITARFNLDIEVIEESAPDYVRSTSKGEEGSRASVVQSTNLVRLADGADGGTDVTYSADVDISGRLGRYGAGMMKKIAGRLAKKFEASFRERAETVEEVD
jgi:carbon monoxide dehydrogenase subunit G